MSIGIYKIENLINHKCYIGQSIHIEERWKQHLTPSVYANPFKPFYNYPLYRAFRKYGIENFNFKIIEKCSKELLNEREIFWIKQYNSYFNGYNQTIGGQGFKKELPPVYQYDIYGNFIKGYDNVAQAAELLQINSTTIYNCLNENNKTKIAGGFQWSYLKLDKIHHGFSSCPVIAFTFNGQRFKMFNSINEAREETHDDYYSIKKSCDTKHHSGTHYQWRYWFENPDLEEIPPYKWDPKESVDQYDLEGNYITTFGSLTDAAKTLNLNMSNLITCCKKRQKSFGGFQWCYHNEEPPSLYIDNKVGRKTACYKKIVQQFSKQNDFLNEYESAHEAARQIGYPQSANHITECCQGKRKTCRNFIWKYKENKIGLI